MHDHSPQIEEHGINPYHPSSVLGICTATYQLCLVMSAPHRFPDVGASPDDFRNRVWTFIYPNRTLPWYCIYLFFHFYSFQYMFQFIFTFIYRMFHRFFVHFYRLSRILHSIKTL